MTCEHCGKVVSLESHVCPQCGAATVMAKIPAKTGGKVIPFRARKKRVKKAPPRQTGSPSWIVWWVLAIVSASLIIPYMLPLHP